MLVLVILLSILIINYEKRNKIKSIKTLQDILDEACFYPTEIHFVNKKLSIALNKSKTKIAIIKNFNPNNPRYYVYQEIALSFIEKIEKNISGKIYYLKKGEINSLNIYPLNKEIVDFLHNIFELSLIKRIENKFPECKFTSYSSSDWECNYFWAYSKYNSTFAYLKLNPKNQYGKINLRKEHFTIDTKFNYFEAPIFGIAQQLFTYNNYFLKNIYEDLLKLIKEKYSQIAHNSIYFDNYSNTTYLTNGTNSLQSIIIDKIDKVDYRDNRILFKLYNEHRTINYIANQEQISEFENFVIDHNLKKIAQGFNNKTDKLINTTPYTKLIIDFSRDRVIYCANLNRFSSFNYITIPFIEIEKINIEKSGIKYFLRINTKNKEIVDITCDKKEVAQYIEVQLSKII
ncbi:MAG: hypothetical protein IKU37_05325 [Candidatus Gastranaerophilales bacterium]|nr:hypothetical protein [Candidatus Gastranaerophilales bacterium]